MGSHSGAASVGTTAVDGATAMKLLPSWKTTSSTA
jgi:hypothetical protein